MTRLLLQAPWPQPLLENCEFYHSFDLPRRGHVEGAWDLRGKFEEYVGGVDLKNRTVFDLGTASGFLAFSAEQAGASRVVAHDAAEMSDTERVPFKDGRYWINKREWSAQGKLGLDRVKNSFWYVHHAFNSKVQAHYGSIDGLLSVSDRFDVVVAGAIFEHLADPVTAIGACCRLSTDIVVIGFTPVHDSEEEFLKPAISWDNAEADYVWYALSRGLYRRVFDNMGFSLEFVPCAIEFHGQRIERSTIVARRR